jgi:bifunctional ADP-heptose synthase (sugar kinase/adenylyltransferase)
VVGDDEAASTIEELLTKKQIDAKLSLIRRYRQLLSFV